VNIIRVSELINVAATWQDAAPVTVAASQTGRVTTFRITNTGNGTDSYALAATGAGIGGDAFDPVVTAVYMDTNGNGAYDPGTDMLATTGTGTIGSDANKTVFVLSTIPNAGVNAGDRGDIHLLVTSQTGTGNPGTSFPGAGEGGTDAVIGASQGVQTATGSYLVSDLVVVMNKTAVVTDLFGGSLALTGATVRYTISVTVTGAGTASGIIITDPIPANTAYTPGTLRLNGAVLSDAAGDDAGDVGGTTANTLTVNAGNLTSASPAQVIIFDVKIN